MGISRLSKLMYKQLKFGTLYDLISEFVLSYESYFHSVAGVDLGLPFSHDCLSETPLQWKFMKLTITAHGKIKRWTQYNDVFLQYSRDCLFIFDYYEKTGTIPKWCTKEYRDGSQGRDDADVVLENGGLKCIIKC